MRTSRSKKIIPGMMPVRKWLTIQEGATYMGMHTDTLRKLVIEKELSLSIIGNKHYVKVAELDELIEANAFRKKDIHASLRIL